VNDYIEETADDEPHQPAHGCEHHALILKYLDE